MEKNTYKNYNNNPQFFGFIIKWMFPSKQLTIDISGNKNNRNATYSFVQSDILGNLLEDVTLEILTPISSDYSATLTGNTLTIIDNANIVRNYTETITVRAYLNENNSIFDDLSLNLRFINNTPVLSTIPDLTLNTNTTMSVDLSNYVVDEDPTNLSYSVTIISDQNDTIITSITNRILFVTSKKWKYGNSLINISVNDGENIDTQTVNITVPFIAPVWLINNPTITIGGNKNKRIFTTRFLQENIDFALIDDLDFTIISPTNSNYTSNINGSALTIEDTLYPIRNHNKNIELQITRKDNNQMFSSLIFNISFINLAPSLRINTLNMDQDAVLTINIRRIMIDEDVDSLSIVVNPRPQEGLITTKLNNDILTIKGVQGLFGSTFITVILSDFERTITRNIGINIRQIIPAAFRAPVATSVQNANTSNVGIQRALVTKVYNTASSNTVVVNNDGSITTTPVDYMSGQVSKNAGAFSGSFYTAYRASLG